MNELRPRQPQQGWRVIDPAALQLPPTQPLDVTALIARALSEQGPRR